MLIQLRGQLTVLGVYTVEKNPKNCILIYALSLRETRILARHYILLSGSIEHAMVESCTIYHSFCANLQLTIFRVGIF